jgi:hypothetical protein
VRLAEESELLGGVLRDGTARSQATRLASALRQRRDRQLGDYRIISELDAHTKSARYRLLPAIGPMSGWERETTDESRDLRDFNFEVPQ